MKSNSTGKLGLALGLFALAIALFFVLKNGNDTPADRSESVHYYCTACMTGFNLDLDAPETSFQTVERNVDSGDAPQARRRSTKDTLERVAKCPACGQFAGHPGRECNQCHESFRQFNEKGQAMICPKCKWDPMTGQEAVSDRLSVLDE